MQFLGEWWVENPTSTTAYLRCNNANAHVLPMMRPIVNNEGYKMLVNHPITATNRPALRRINGTPLGTTPTTGGDGWTRVPMRRWDAFFVTFDTNNQGADFGMSFYVDNYQNTSSFLSTRRGLIIAVRSGNELNSDGNIQLANGMTIGRQWEIVSGNLTARLWENQVFNNPWLAMSPHLWPVNQEIAFPDNSFGRRCTGTIPSPGSFFTLFNTGGQITIRNVGGQIIHNFGQGGLWRISLFSKISGVGVDAITYSISSDSVRLDHSSANNDNYDLWIKYTK